MYNDIETKIVQIYPIYLKKKFYWKVIEKKIIKPLLDSNP